MTTSPLLRKLNPRVIDFHDCPEWPVESDRMSGSPALAPAIVATVKVEAAPARAVDRLARRVRAHDGQAWTCARGDDEADLVVRARLDALRGACEQESDPVGDAIVHVLQAYQTRRFRMPLAKGCLRLGPRVAVMGILNVTPDSFSDGGQFLSTSRAIDHALAMCEAGADIVDVGGESTRPGAAAVDAAEETRRVVPVIEALAGRIAPAISIDTSKAAVAREALAAGARIVNDVTGLSGDPDMAEVVAESKAPVVVMHMRGAPRTMQRRPRYRDVMSEIAASLRSSMARAAAAGVEERQVLIDPGIGFGKTVKHNLEILRRLHELRSLGRPLLMGTSRKSFIGKTLDRAPEERVWGTAATVAWCVAQGALVVRVHDVAPAVDVARMTTAMASVRR